MARHYHRGEVVLVYVKKEGSPVRKTRPCVVVQNDTGNERSNLTILVHVNLYEEGGRRYPVNVVIDPATDGVELAHVSVADCALVVTIAQDQIARSLGKLPKGKIDELNAALKVSFGL